MAPVDSVEQEGPMRVAQVVGKMVNGGLEAVVMNYYRHIDRTKIQFDFFVDEDSTCIPREEIERLGGRVYIIPPYQELHRYIPALVRLFRENGYRIVHSHINAMSVFPLYAAKQAGVPVRIAHSHSTAGRGEWKKNILKYVLRLFSKKYATHYAACSRLAGEWLFGKRSMERGEVTIFHNAIDLEKFRYDERVRREVREEMGLEGKFVVGHVGRFCYQKNQGFLLDVFAEVCKQDPDAVLLLVGDGPDREKIEKKAKNLGGVRVILTGNRTDVWRLYQAMDVFVFPSRYEGLGMAAVEAQMCKVRSILSAAVPEEAQILPETVFLDLTQGVAAWTEQIRKTGELVQNFRRGESMQLWAVERYDITVQAQKWRDYYEGMRNVEERRRKETEETGSDPFFREQE